MHDDEIDWREVDEAGFAILCMTLHDGCCVWKGFSWELMDRWHACGWIDDPRNKAKSVILTREGVAKARELFQKRFTKKTSRSELSETSPISNRLHGWDDEKIYFTTADGREHCVTDDPALRDRLADLCEAHFAGKKS